MYRWNLLKSAAASAFVSYFFLFADSGGRKEEQEIENTFEKLQNVRRLKRQFRRSNLWNSHPFWDCKTAEHVCDVFKLIRKKSTAHRWWWEEKRFDEKFSWITRWTQQQSVENFLNYSLRDRWKSETKIEDFGLDLMKIHKHIFQFHHARRPSSSTPRLERNVIFQSDAIFSWSSWTTKNEEFVNNIRRRAFDENLLCAKQIAIDTNAAYVSGKGKVVNRRKTFQFDGKS